MLNNKIKKLETKVIPELKKKCEDKETEIILLK